MLRTLYYAGNIPDTGDFKEYWHSANDGCDIRSRATPCTPTAPAEQPAFKVSDAQKIELYIDEPRAELVFAFRAAATIDRVRDECGQINNHAPSSGATVPGPSFLTPSYLSKFKASHFHSLHSLRISISGYADAPLLVDQLPYISVCKRAPNQLMI